MRMKKKQQQQQYIHAMKWFNELNIRTNATH